jgi:hypothetical protein
MTGAEINNPDYMKQNEHFTDDGCCDFFYVRDTHRLVHETDRFEGITWVHVVSRQPLTAEVRFRARVSLYGICGEQSGSETDFSPSFSVFPVSILPPWLSIHVYYLEIKQMFVGGHSSET